jgi:hypothetical protein
MVAFSRGSFIYITKSAQLCCIQSPARPTRPSACLPVNTIHMIIISIHNATRERERERIPSNSIPAETSITCTQVATSAQLWELPRCATAFRSNCTRASLHSRPHRTTHYRAKRQQSRDEPTAFQISPTCARQLIIPWVTANRVPFLQRTRPRHAQPGVHTQDASCILRSGIASPVQLRSVALDTQTCASN